jgi:hypothetical protein
MNEMKQKGFIKLKRNLLSDPKVAALVEQEGATGLGTYVIILLYLSTCDDFEGAFTRKQICLLAATARKIPIYVRHLIEDSGLFKVENNRFRSVLMDEPSFNGRSTAVQNPRANLLIRAGEEIEIDKEKEKRKSEELPGVCLTDTPVAFDKEGRPLT